MCRPSMFDGVVYGFLGYAVQMSGYGVVEIYYRVVALEPALDMEKFFNFARPFLQRRH